MDLTPVVEAILTLVNVYVDLVVFTCIQIGTQSIPKCLHKSPCARHILKNDLIL